MATVTPLVISRRVFQQLSKKNPKQIRPDVPPRFKKKDDTSWPRSMRIAAYTAIGIAIPYSIGVVISESPRIRSQIEGDRAYIAADDEVESTTAGQKLVDFVRWFWGEEEHVPAGELIDTLDRDGNDAHAGLPVSLANDPPAHIRLEQAKIQNTIQSKIHVQVTSTDGQGSITSPATISGDVPLDGNQLWNSLHQSEKGVGKDDEDSAILNRRVSVTVDDEDGENGNEIVFSDNTSSALLLDEGITTNPATMLKQESVIKSPWDYSGRASNANAQQEADTGASNKLSAEPQSLASMTADQIRMEELQWNINELQKSLLDPSCTRNMDEMQQELTNSKSQLRQLKRQKWTGRVRNIFS